MIGIHECRVCGKKFTCISGDKFKFMGNIITGCEPCRCPQCGGTCDIMIDGIVYLDGEPIKRIKGVAVIKNLPQEMTLE